MAAVTPVRALACAGHRDDPARGRMHEALGAARSEHHRKSRRETASHRARIEADGPPIGRAELARFAIDVFGRLHREEVPIVRPRLFGGHAELGQHANADGDRRTGVVAHAVVPETLVVVDEQATEIGGIPRLAMHEVLERTDDRVGRTAAERALVFDLAHPRTQIDGARNRARKRACTDVDRSRRPDRRGMRRSRSDDRGTSRTGDRSAGRRKRWWARAERCQETQWKSVACQPGVVSSSSVGVC